MGIKALTSELTEILAAIEAKEGSINEITAQLHPKYKKSGKNLCRYLLFRNYDLRKYHDRLSEIGLSSLRSSEGYVYGNLFNVVKHLHMIQNMPFSEIPHTEIIGYKKSKKLIKKHASELFNAVRNEHFTEIMVTLPTEAADNKTMIEEMIDSGMEIARIDLSHGDLEIWTKMVRNIQIVRAETKKQVKIFMDLARPKISTTKIQIVSKNGKIKNSIPIRKGEHIILTSKATLGKASKFGELNEQLDKAEIGVSLPEIIQNVCVNDVVLFEDGMIKAIVLAKCEDCMEVVITHCYKNELTSYKAINLPNTPFELPTLTKRDSENLPFVIQYADIVGHSFVRTASDVRFLFKKLYELGGQHLGVVFKIQSKRAFKNLPQILLAGMKHDKIGVMIARGDLAVEIGFDRIAEVQKQILWICEAAHVPVIWATQVLENLAKTGIPTRAEVSDAAYGANAECIMLDKGPYINDAIATLRDILIRVEAHGFKKKAALRSLNVAKAATEQIFYEYSTDEYAQLYTHKSL